MGLLYACTRGEEFGFREPKTMFCRVNKFLFRKHIFCTENIFFFLIQTVLYIWKNHVENYIETSMKKKRLTELLITIKKKT